VTTRNDHSALVRSITATVNQYAKDDPSNLAEHIADKLEAGYQIVKSEWPEKQGPQFRPHLWPQPSSVSDRHMRCLNCGAAFWERRAEGPCQPRE